MDDGYSIVCFLRLLFNPLSWPAFSTVSRHALVRHSSPAPRRDPLSVAAARSRCWLVQRHLPPPCILPGPPGRRDNSVVQDLSGGLSRQVVD
jgi:hypothetical protein